MRIRTAPRTRSNSFSFRWQRVLPRLVVVVVGMWLSLAHGESQSTALVLGQATADVANINAYLTVTGSDGSPVTSSESRDFAASFGSSGVDIASVQPFAESGEGIGYVFLVDISKSLSSNRFAQLRAGLTHWISGMGEKDRAAILTFGDEVQILSDFSADPWMLNVLVEELVPRDNRTRLYQALSRAIDTARRGDPGLPKRRVIVVLSDGVDEGLRGDVTSDEIVQAVSVDPIPIHSIGFRASTAGSQADRGWQELGRLARASGGSFHSVQEQSFDAAYGGVRETIAGATVVTMSCPSCARDGEARTLRITLRSGGRELSDAIQFRLFPPAAETTAEPEAEEQQPEALGNAGDAAQAEDSQPVESAEASEPPEGSPVEQIEETTAAEDQSGDEQSIAGGSHESDLHSNAEPPAGKLTYWIWLAVIGGAMVLVLLAKKLKQGQEHEQELSRTIPEEQAAESVQTYSSAPPSAPLPPTTQVQSVTRTERAETEVGSGIDVIITTIKGIEPTPERRIHIRDKISLGREPQCEFVVEGDEEISGVHCVLGLKQGRLVLTDLGSTNGTFLNGVAVKGHAPVADRDVIRMGRTEIRLYTPDEERA